MTILGMDLVTLKLDSLTDAKVTGNTIEFTLAVSGKFLGADFPASVHFVGTKQFVIILSSNEIKFRKSKEKAVKRLSLSSFFVCY